MLNTYVEMIKKYFSIKGRVNRHDYWLGLLIMLIFLSVLLWFAEKIPALHFLPVIFAAAMIIPTITSTVRRLHDIGKSGWWALLFLVPVIGWVGIFIYLILDTETEELLKAKASHKLEKKLPVPRLRDGYNG